VTAATAAGRDLGLKVARPRVLHDLFSVIVHLAPSPVVARLPIVVPAGIDPDALIAKQVRELTMVGWLGDANQPVVRPSPLVPRLPVQRDGFSITLWEYVEVEGASAPDFTANASLVTGLHKAMRDYPFDLPFLSPVTSMMSSSVRFLEEHPGLLGTDDVDRLHNEWDILAPVLASPEAFLSAVPGAHFHPIHGDAPYYNLMPTSAGPRHSDFEDVCRGPLEWDMAMAGPEAVAAYNAAAGAAGAPQLDPVVLRIMEAARKLQLVASFALVPQLPVLAGLLTPIRDEWRSTPLAGGLG